MKRQYSNYFTMRTSSRLKPLLRRLPFDLDDTARLNAVFDRWIRMQQPSDREVLDVWTYCYTWRYFLSKAARDNLRRPSDIDALTAQAFRRACCTRDDVEGVLRYANWVSVVCRNTYVNYANRGREMESIESVRGEVVTEPAPTYNDEPLVRRVLLSAINRLPPYLQDTARLFFVEQYTFETIAARLGKPIDTVRTYKSRALHTLRQDDALLEASGRTRT